MTHLYPREKRQIFALGGVFDDFDDVTLSATKWFNTWTGTNVVKTFPAAPGLSGNALNLKGTIGDALGLDACGAVGYVQNRSYLYYVSPKNPYQWKMKAEFRMRIADDEVDASNKLSCSSGFCLDGAVSYFDTHNKDRMYVLFSVANQRVGIAGASSGGSLQVGNIVYDEEWVGSLDTWYDVRIEWEHDWHSTTAWMPSKDQYLSYIVRVYVNNSLLFEETIEFSQWKDNYTGTGWSSRNYCLGRCGPTIICENDGGATNGNYVEAYFKDVYITRDVQLARFEFEDSILSKKYPTLFEATLKCTFPHAITEGMDVQFYKRNSLTDPFIGHFRGLIRATKEAPGKKRVWFQAEGYNSILSGEKTEVDEYTAQTAAVIIDDIVNSPDDKYLFDTSTYFDSATTTYNRSYKNLFKIDPLMEMASLEGFILFLDIANNLHFENYFTNETDIHLMYGKDRIIKWNYEATFIRRPNFLRVIGNGVQSTRQVAEDTFSNYSVVYRNINRLDLTTQTEVDEALAYYMSGVLEPIRVIDVLIRPDWSITKGKVIRVTIPDLLLDNAEVLVLSIHSDIKGVMTLRLLEILPSTILFLAELYERTETQESNAFPSDDVENEKVVDIEAQVDFYATFVYQIDDAYNNCVAQGQGIISDHGMDMLFDFWGSTNPSMDGPVRMMFGTGTTPAKPSDTGLENEFNSIIAYRQEDPEKKTAASGGWHKEYGVLYRIEAAQQGSMPSTYDLSEIGLENNDGDEFFARAVFPTLTDLDRQLTTFRCWIVFGLKHGPAYLTTPFLIYLGGYIVEAGGFPYNSWSPMTRMMITASNSFSAPHPLCEDNSEEDAALVVCPRLAADQTFTQTKIAARRMYKMEWTYDFDFADRWLTTDGDPPVAWLSLTRFDSTFSGYINVYYRTDKVLSDYLGHTFHAIIWLRFRRGYIDPNQTYGDHTRGCPPPCD